MFAGNTHSATDGVTLSSVLWDKDCKRMGLWRIALSCVPKVQSVKTPISQAKGQRKRSLAIAFW